MADDLFAPLSSTAAMREAVSGRAWLRAMLDAEAALAAACVTAGLVPHDAAAAIREACAADRFDVASIAAEATSGGNPVIPLVRHLRAAVPDSAADFVHYGATSQDILDTALVLVVRRAWSVIDTDLLTAARELAALAAAHRHTVMAARTLLQQALPTTFGLKAAGWLVALVDARGSARAACHDRLRAQLGGGAGTLAAFGTHGLDVVAAFAAALDLPAPALPWPTARGRIGEIGGSLAVLAGTCAKIALDVGLLAQTEVGEARESSGAGRGGSSTLPHKQNPVGVAAVRAAHRHALGHAQVLLGAIDHEHERALGAWHAEWEAVSALLLATGAAVHGTANMVGGLEVDAGRMAANLEITGGLVMAEAVVGALAPGIGRRRARELVEAAARRSIERRAPLREELVKDQEIAARLDSESVDRLLEPTNYLGAYDALIDRALSVFAEAEGEA
ncbi:MAG: 3-carboxy-cis,cis-muconate cycloisomerase [Acidimicrobiales bacterium]